MAAAGLVLQDSDVSTPLELGSVSSDTDTSQPAPGGSSASAGSAASSQKTPASAGTAAGSGTASGTGSASSAGTAVADNAGSAHGSHVVPAEGDTQYDDPNDSSSFYNADNWHAWYQQQEEGFVITRPELNLYAGWLPTFSFPLPGGVPALMHLDASAWWALAGATVRFDWLFAEFAHGYHGIGTNVTWNYLRDEQEYYVLTANHFTANLFYVLKFNLAHGISVQAHAGGGVMVFVLPTFQYDSGFAPESYEWVYPEVAAGGKAIKRFGDHFNLNLGVDFVFPFGLKVAFPQMQFSAGSGWEF